MLRKPHALKALLLGVRDLLERFVDPLRFAGRGPGFGNLDLIEQANSHGTVSLSRNWLTESYSTARHGGGVRPGGGAAVFGDQPSEQLQQAFLAPRAGVFLQFV